MAFYASTASLVMIPWWGIIKTYTRRWEVVSQPGYFFFESWAAKMCIGMSDGSSIHPRLFVLLFYGMLATLLWTYFEFGNGSEDVQQMVCKVLLLTYCDSNLGYLTRWLLYWIII
ncbi:hypothetical protein Cni_G24529 [Canna indica]|uniref:Uncharacterized protein n=1 Tax=Canna indica TaxID=4628 RepID=A0AAQ3QNA2_9LILI|nr:hypothetical protein Cni_G24529 [Canna indica]